MGDNLALKQRDTVVDEVAYILKEYSDGLTITEIVDETKITRSAVRTALAKLDGAERVVIRKIGMAKVYLLSERKRM